MSDEWAGLLDPDERIVWQGAPKIRIRLEWNNPKDILIVLSCIGFWIMWVLDETYGSGLELFGGLLLSCLTFYTEIGRASCRERV